MAVSSTTGGLRTGVCLSTDRPQNPYDGQVVYETDTNRTLVWDNSAWVVISDPALVSYSGSAASVTGNLTGNVTGDVTGDLTGDVTASAVTIGGENVTPYTGRKNYIYNGAMQIAQRGSSVSTSGGYTLDRWRIEPVNEAYSAGIAGNVQQVEDAGYAMSVRSGGTAPGFYMIEQRFDGQDVAHLAGRTVTFSFKVKRVSTTITQGVIRVNHDDDLSGSLRDEATIATVENNVTTISTSAYEQYSTSYTFPATVSTGGYYRIGIYFHGMGGAPASGELFRIKDVQLELGNKATPFEHRSFGEELALCQRYFWRCVDPAGVGVADSLGRATRVLIPFHVEMRAIPTSVVGGTLNFWNGGSTGTATGLLLTVNTKNHGQLDFNGGTGSAADSCTLYTTGGSQYIDFAAEL